MVDSRHRAGDRARRLLDQVLPAGQQRCLGHPDQVRVETRIERRLLPGPDQHVATTDVDLVFECDGDRLRWEGFFQFAVVSDDGLDPAAFPRRQREHGVALSQDAGGQRTAETTEIQVWPIDPLHREPEVVEVLVVGDLDAIQQFHQRRTVEPGGPFAAPDDVVALQRRQRNEADLGNVETAGKFEIRVANAFIHRLAEVHQVHLVDGHDDVPDPEQRDDEAVTPGLRLHAVAGVDEDDRQIAVRGAGGHVARVLLVARRIGDDELAPGGGEIAIGDIDGNPLLTLRLQAIDQQRQVDLVAGGPAPEAVSLHGRQLIFVDQLGIVQQTTDQRALAVIDAAAGEKTQQFLALVLGQIGLDVGTDQFGLVGHGLP